MTQLTTIQGSNFIDATMSDIVFNRIATIAHKEAGIALSRSKENMVKSRLLRRLKALRIETFERYLDLVEDKVDTAEMSQFISALTTNISHFFREEHHFTYLQNEIFPILQQKLKSGRKVRIWSAGCSNGQEPYSIAMTLLNLDQNIGQSDTKILATDIDPEVLKFAMTGQYTGSMTTGLTEDTRNVFFASHSQNGEDILTIKPIVKDLISFRQLNLHAEWPMKGTFDLIFCRNVAIYFDLETQNTLYKRYVDILSTESWLMLGHSERLGEDAEHLFERVGITTYKPMK